MAGVLSPEKIWKEGGGSGASGRIPQDAEFFQDHFPCFPVLPGVVALDLLKQTAEYGGGKKLVAILRVKFSSYLKPGDEWESRAERVATGRKNEVEYAAKLLHAGKAAVTARLIFES